MECGLSPNYIFDEAPIYEINLLMKNYWRKEKEKWNQTRFISYCILQSQSTKKLKMKDIITFPWDEEDKEKEKHIASTEEIKSLKEKADGIKQQLNGEALA